MKEGEDDEDSDSSPAKHWDLSPVNTLEKGEYNNEYEEWGDGK